MDQMKYKIGIPKNGKNAGVARFEGMEKNENCHDILEEVAVSIGKISSVTDKEHFDDDNPVFDDVTINENDNE